MGGYGMTQYSYFSLALITLLMAVLISFEIHRRKTLALVDQGYYFVEQLVNVRRTAIIPVPPENVDTSDPAHPRIINPALVRYDPCSCAY